MGIDGHAVPFGLEAQVGAALLAVAFAIGIRRVFDRRILTSDGFLRCRPCRIVAGRII
jgi:hypothetical protein